VFGASRSTVPLYSIKNNRYKYRPYRTYIYIYTLYREKSGWIGSLEHGKDDMKEKEIEEKLRREVKAMGGLALKFISPGLSGVPDRIVLLPEGRIAFVELKAPGKTMRPLQLKRKRQLEALGFKFYCIDRPEQIGGILHEI
jgi:hypothetical protein